MQITEIRMFVCDEPRLKATLSLTFSDVFVIKGVKVIDGRQGMFVAMPSRKTEGGFEDICHPVKAEFREYVEEEVLRAYAEEAGIPFQEVEARRRRNAPKPPEGEPATPDGKHDGESGGPNPGGSDRSENRRGSDERSERRPRGDDTGDSGFHPST